MSRDHLSIYSFVVESVSPTFTFDIRRLHTLRELQRRGTLAETAEALHLTASAVSQQLAALSREAGVPLLERDGRRVRLTGQANILLDHAAKIAALLEHARADLSAWSAGKRGSITIGAFSSAISGLLPHLFISLEKEQADIDVRVVEAEPPRLFTQLDRGDIDLAIAVDFAAAPPHTDARYSRTDLLIDSLDIALPASHRLARRARIPLRALAQERWIVGDPAAAAARSPAPSAPPTASPQTFDTPPTTGTLSPLSSRPAQASPSSLTWSNSTGQVSPAADPTGRRPAATSSSPSEPAPTTTTSCAQSAPTYSLPPPQSQATVNAVNR